MKLNSDTKTEASLMYFIISFETMGDSRECPKCCVEIHPFISPSGNPFQSFQHLNRVSSNDLDLQLLQKF